MKNVFKTLLAISAIAISALANANESFQIDYDKEIMLDAEALAEGGISQAYEKIKPELSHYLKHPEKIEEVMDNDTPSYSIKFRGETLAVYGPNVNEKEIDSWRRATYVLFYIVNSQLSTSDVKFYAQNGGNDLGGMFLTIDQYKRANKSMKREIDKFYLPTLKP